MSNEELIEIGDPPKKGENGKREIKKPLIEEIESESSASIISSEKKVTKNKDSDKKSEENVHTIQPPSSSSDSQKSEK